MDNSPWFELADSLRIPQDPSLKDQYLAAFVDPATRIIPVESAYKHSKLPFAPEKGHTLSDRGLYMRALLNKYRLEIPPDLDHAPDHLAMQLKVLGFLLKNQKIAEANSFVQKHLSWIDDLVKSAEERLPQGNYYLDKIKAIRDALLVFDEKWK